MSTDALLETPIVPETSRTPRGGGRSESKRTRWVGRALAVCGVLAAMGLVAVLLVNVSSSGAISPKLTHTITRGDLVVTVTEQGTLESSNNTEIKCKVRGNSTVIWVVDGGTEVKESDVLVRLDTKQIEDAISLQTTSVHTARATLAESKAAVANAEIAVPAYLEGSYRLQAKALERGLAIAEENLLAARKMLSYSEKLFKRGYVTELEVEGNAFTVTQAELELQVSKTELEVLDKYTKEMELETLRGNLTAAKSKFEADTVGLAMDEGRLELATKELEYCVMKADRTGLVIYPSAAQWKQTPDIAEGATVRKDQVLLLMPDLTKMQVKVGVHESVVDQIKPGLAARITLPYKTLDGKVASVASVTRPAGWWTGNVVKYDTIIELPAVEGLKPGMSAEVEVVLARHENVLTIPVAAAVQTEEGDCCWVQTDNGTQRRSIMLGATNDSFIVVERGLKEGDQVVLNPVDLVNEAEAAVQRTGQEATGEKQQAKRKQSKASTKAAQPASQEADDDK